MSHHTFLLLMLWVGVTVSREVDLQKRIYGGNDCDKTERLYHVSLSKVSDGKPGHCGGSLISKQWILTAAHCKKDPLYAVVGVHPGPRTAVEIDKKDIIPHKDDDIMLLKLPHEIETIVPVALPACKDVNDNLNTKPHKGEEVQMAGHGRYRIDPTTRKKLPGKPANLQCASMRVADCDHTKVDDCYSQVPYKAPQGNRLCYEGTDVDTCGGDSGGGVIHDKQIYAVHVGSGECACSIPAFSLRVCSYIDWINDNINK